MEERSFPLRSSISRFVFFVHGFPLTSLFNIFLLNVLFSRRPDTTNSQGGTFAASCDCSESSDVTGFRYFLVMGWYEELRGLYIIDKMSKWRCFQQFLDTLAKDGQFTEYFED